MPWFNYNYPGDTDQPSSYNVLTGTPSCTGETLCAIYASSTGTIPARPVLTNPVLQAISKALDGEITPGVTMLRPNP